jgi:hypothetical protein
MASADDSACLTPSADLAAYSFNHTAERYVYCTTDGESWDRYAVTPDARTDGHAHQPAM